MDIDLLKIKLSKLYKDYNLYFEVLEYFNSRNILIKNKYGVCKSTTGNLLKGKLPSITTSLNKNSYFINQAKEIHGDKYDYSKILVEKSSNKIKIICSTHGEFEQTPNNHLRGQGCPICGTIITNKKQTLTIDKFIEKANYKHNYKYNYNNVLYKNCFKKVEIICPIHGSFLQTPGSHLYGCGCPNCKKETISKARSTSLNGWNYKIWEQKALSSKRFDSFKCYILFCWNEEETFYKIGKTFLTIEKRYPNKSVIPYNYKIINIIEDSALNISKLETTLKNINKKQSYIPLLNFGGKYECFTKILQYP